MRFTRRAIIVGAGASLAALGGPSLAQRQLPGLLQENGKSLGERDRFRSEAPTLTPEQFGADGSVSNDTAALQTALDRARERGNATVLLSRRYLVSAPLRHSGGKLLIEGVAPDAGLVLRHTGDGLMLGSSQRDGGPRDYDVYLNRFQIHQEASGSIGAAVRLHHTARARLTYLVLVGTRHAIVLGEDARLKEDDVIDAMVVGCRLSPVAGNAMQLNSGALLKISDTMFNGQGAAGIAAVTIGTRWMNCDGAYIYANTFEEWNRHIVCRSKGMGNVGIFHNIMDRSREIGIELRPQKGGSIHQVTIESNNVTDRPFELGDDSVGLLASTQDGGRITSLSIQDNRIHHFGKQGLYLHGLNGFLITGNDIFNCSRKTADEFASLHLESCSAGIVSGNLIRGETHRYGILAADLSQVSVAQNAIVGALTAPTKGI